ncbi:MAG: nuclear transport factor 2 family protein [Aggregatilineales bacterium]
MRYIRWFVLLALLLSLTVAVSAQEMNDMALCDTVDTPELAPSAGVRAMMVLGGLQSGDISAAETFVSADTYIQHNLSAPDGLDGLLGVIPLAAEGGASSVNFHRVLVQGNLVALHTSYNLPIFGGELVGFDIFRFDEDGQIVEHWDNLMPVAEPNPGGHTQTDGSVTITGLDRTQANCEKVVEFVTRALVTPDPELDITQYINPASYTQHNPAVADGLEGFGAFLQSLAENNQVIAYSQIHLVVAQGNFVLIASEGVFGDADNPTPTAFYDLFRLEDGLIVEHWDVISPIPPQEEWVNQNGKF